MSTPSGGPGVVHAGPTSAPLDRLTSIRTKLGALVAVSVVVAAAVATLGERAGVAPWLALPITVALALAVTQLLAVGMTSPLREMTSAATRMAGGDHDVRVRAESADEVGELARAFNRMAADLGEVDQRRRDLVATVSHELRTPLAGLVAVLENLHDGVATPGTDPVRQALVQAERLSALVADLLDLSRLEAGATSLDRGPVAVRALLLDAVAEARTLGRPVTYDVRVVPADLVVEADAARLHQLVGNLLDNASRHSPAGGTVDVDAAVDPGGTSWQLEVANDGDPIPAGERERIFTRFGTTDPGGGGSGLGLAIARWVSDLHGGTLAAVDPRPGRGGARLRAVLPTHAAPPAVPSPVQPPAQPPAPSPAPSPDPLPPAPSRGRLSWATEAAPPRPGLLGGSILVGLLAALLVVDQRPGLGSTAVLLAGGGVVLLAHRHRREPFTVTCALLAAALVSVLTLRAALWVGVLACLAATVLVVVASARARSVSGIVLAGVCWPLAAVAGLPWLGRTIRAVSGSGRGLAVVRTVVLTGCGLLVFGLLFASADALFAGWVGALVPDLRVDAVVARVFVGCAVAGLVLATAFLALVPPQVEASGPVVRRPTRHRWEWLAPVLAVDAVFVVFLASQAASVVGGHGYVERSTGLTYAAYVHQGFGQLVLATLLTVLVVSVAARKASVLGPGDRRWLRGALGALCALTLLVVASALHRLVLYTDAYGLTRLRLVAGTFELWLGLVVLALVVAGIGLHGAWLPRAAVLGGAALVLLLAVADPDAWIARTNVERLDTTGRVDLAYLGGLSADAVPALRELPPDVRDCVLADLAGRAGREEGARKPWEWNLGARHLDGLAVGPAAGRVTCPGVLVD
jgi:signal transduction histidine kinase